MQSFLLARSMEQKTRGVYEPGLVSSNDIASWFRRFLYYILAISFAYTTNTLHGTETGHMYDVMLIMLIMVFAFTLCMIAYRGIDRIFASRWALFAVCVVSAYSLVCIVNGAEPWKNVQMFNILLIVLPGFIHILREIEELELFLRSFVNTMAILAVLSIVIWLLGSLLHVVIPSSTYETHWAGYASQVDSYFNLQYEVQRQEIPTLGVFFRNTGLYTEAPMYSYALCIALCFEALFQKRSRKAVVTVLALCIITTASVTGLIVVIGLFLYKTVKRVDSQVRIMMVFIVVIVGLTLMGSLLIYKYGSISGSTRLDDFKSGMLAWFESPIFGLGFSRYYDVIMSYMGLFRAGNMGFSNTVTDILAQGGIVYLIPMASSFAGYFAKRGKRCDSIVAGVLFVYLWAVTIVTYLPLTALIMALGVERMHVKDNHKSKKNTSGHVVSSY